MKEAALKTELSAKQWYNPNRATNCEGSSVSGSVNIFNIVTPKYKANYHTVPTLHEQNMSLYQDVKFDPI